MDLGGFHRFQLKSPFRSIIVLTYSSILVSLNDTHRDSYGIQALKSVWPSRSKLIQQTFRGLDPMVHAQLNIAAADSAVYFLLEEQIPRDVGDSILEH